MDVIPKNFLPGDPVLVEKIVYELKSQGIFDQFRKECISDVDTKPAYQNLRQRVEGSVTGFLKKQTWQPDMNKNQVREMLRKNIQESGFLETGVERIVDQVVNPKINSIFLPKVTEVVYKYLGLEKPKVENKPVVEQLEIKTENLLPTDLEAVSPDSVVSEKKEEKNADSVSLNDSKIDEDESPPFEPIDRASLVNDERSNDSHMSGFSGLVSHDSNHSIVKHVEMDISNQDSKFSFDGHLSIVMSEDNDTKMEICEDSQSKSCDASSKTFDFIIDSSDKSSTSFLCDKKEDEIKLEITDETDDKKEKEEKREQDKLKYIKKEDRKERDEKKEKDDRKNDKKEIKKGERRDKEKDERKDKDSKRDKDDKKDRDRKYRDDKKDNKDDKKDKDRKHDRSRSDDKRSDKYKYDSHKSRSDCKSESKDRKDDKKVEKTPSKDSKDNSKDSKYRDRDKSKESRDRKDSSSKSKCDKDNKSERDKDKEKSDRKSSSSSNRHNSSSRDKSESSSSRKESSSSSKDRVDNKDRSKSSTSNKEEKTKGDYKSSSSKSDYKSSSKKDDRRSTSHSSSSKKETKDKDKRDSRKDSKKESKDDHFSVKDKKSDRRSTDRDSNDGQSGSYSSASFSESTSSSQQQQKSQDSLDSSNSGSGSTDSGNSENTEQTTPNETISSQDTYHNQVFSPRIEMEGQVIKWIKPKVASNIHEARKLMKIRKQLQKMEKRGMDLNLIKAKFRSDVSNSDESKENKHKFNIIGEEAQVAQEEVSETKQLLVEEGVNKESTSSLQSAVVSAATWDEIEAKLNQNINYDSYIDDTDQLEEIPSIPAAKVNKEECLYLTSEVLPETERYQMFVPKYLKNLKANIENMEICLKTQKPAFILHKNKPISSLEHTPEKDESSLEMNRGIKRKLMTDDQSDLHNNNKKNNCHIEATHDDKFPLPLSPAESEKSIDVKIRKSNVVTKGSAASKRYSSDDLYKPRPIFKGSRRRGKTLME